jgi:hypothetical protein
MVTRLSLLACLGLINVNIQAATELLTFHNQVIHDLDGKIFMIDGYAIHDMLIVIRKATMMQFGQKNGSEFIGHYTYKNQKYSIHQLSQLEEVTTNPDELTPLLVQAKHDFIEATQAFAKNIKTAKKLVLSLMTEFCERRNRPNSLILSWAKTNGGNEEHVFNQVITSFKVYDVFLDDLTLFLKDLINSCPKARQQYQEWQKKQHHSTE